MPDDTELDPGAAALHWHDRECAHTDEALKALQSLDATHDMRAVTTAAAILGAQSNRELAAVIMAAADTVAGDLRSAARLVDRGTARLIVATWALTVAAIIAALFGAYVTLKVGPQIITVGRP